MKDFSQRGGISFFLHIPTLMLTRSGYEGSKMVSAKRSPCENQFIMMFHVFS
jgi:hypothetical protein